jgi:hypothetical protein
VCLWCVCFSHIAAAAAFLFLNPFPWGVSYWYHNHIILTHHHQPPTNSNTHVVTVRLDCHNWNLDCQNGAGNNVLDDKNDNNDNDLDKKRHEASLDIEQGVRVVGRTRFIPRHRRRSLSPSFRGGGGGGGSSNGEIITSIFPLPPPSDRRRFEFDRHSFTKKKWGRGMKPRAKRQLSLKEGLLMMRSDGDASWGSVGRHQPKENGGGSGMGVVKSPIVVVVGGGGGVVKQKNNAPVDTSQHKRRSSGLASLLLTGKLQPPPTTQPQQHHNSTTTTTTTKSSSPNGTDTVPTDRSSPSTLADHNDQPSNNNSVFRRVLQIGSKMNRKLSFRPRNHGHPDDFDDNDYGATTTSQQTLNNEPAPANGIPRVISFLLENTTTMNEDDEDEDDEDISAAAPTAQRRGRGPTVTTTTTPTTDQVLPVTTTKHKGTTRSRIPSTIHATSVGPDALEDMDVDKVKKLRLYIDKYKPDTFQGIVDRLEACQVLEKLELIRSSPGGSGGGGGREESSSVGHHDPYLVRTFKELQSLYTAVRFIPNLKTLIVKNFETHDCKLLGMALRRHPTIQHFHLALDSEAWVDDKLMQSLITMPRLKDVVIQSNAPFPCALLLESKSLQVLRIGLLDRTISTETYEFQRQDMADLALALQNNITLTVLDLEPHVSSYSLRKLANALQINSRLERFYFSFDSVTVRGGHPRDIDTPILALIEAMECNTELKVIQNHCSDRVEVNPKLQQMFLDAIWENGPLTVVKVFKEPPKFAKAKREVFRRKKGMHFTRALLCQEEPCILTEISKWLL